MMTNVRNVFLACIAATFGVTAVAANAENSPSAAQYIENHGGTVDVSKNNGTATVNVTTGKGGTYSGSAVQNKKIEGLWYDTSSTATTANGTTYSGSGYAYKHDVYSGQTKGTAQGISHSGSVTGDSRTVDVASSRQQTLYPEESSTTSVVGHTRSISGDSNQHSKYMTVVTQNDNIYFKRGEENNLHGKQGNSLQTKTSVSIDKYNGTTTVIPNYTGDSYVIFNDQPVTPPK